MISMLTGIRSITQRENENDKFGIYTFLCRLYFNRASGSEDFSEKKFMICK